MARKVPYHSRNGANTPKSENCPSAGFSLIELLIVVAIILIIAAVAIPNLLGAYRSQRVLGGLGSRIATAEVTYNAPTLGYAPRCPTWVSGGGMHAEFGHGLPY